MPSIKEDQIEIVFTPKKMKVWFLDLLRAGCSKEEAGNILGTLIGLHPVPNGWTLKELNHMLFLMELSKTTPP